MPPIFQKLNLKNQTEILVLNPPASFEPELASLTGVAVVRDPDLVAGFTFSLAFVIKQLELDEIADRLLPKARGDALLWFAYPKGTSKKYHCEFNRDTGWTVLNLGGFRPIRQVAIDEDWSALRFRRVEFVKEQKSLE